MTSTPSAANALSCAAESGATAAQVTATHTTADWVLVSTDTTLPDGKGVTAWVDDVELAIFRVGNEWLAIDGRCPHKGASLAEGCVEGAAVSCPWHGWGFDLRTGACDRTPAALRTFAVRADDAGLWLDRSPLALPRTPIVAADDGIQRVLVRYGALGWVGVFGTVNSLTCQHRDWVVVQSDRGSELGEVLADPSKPISSASKPTGELLRVATSAEQAAHRARQDKVDQALAAAKRLCESKSLPVEFVDGEVLFDGETLVLYYLGEFQADFAELRTRLAIGLSMSRVDVHPLLEPAGGGCGSGGCGSCASH